MTSTLPGLPLRGQANTCKAALPPPVARMLIREETLIFFCYYLELNHINGIIFNRIPGKYFLYLNVKQATPLFPFAIGLGIISLKYNSVFSREFKPIA